MKIFLPLFAAWLLLAADGATDGNSSWVNFRWQDLTALAIVAIVLCFIVIRMLPDMIAKYIRQAEIFAAAMKEMQMAFTAVLDNMHARTEERDKLWREGQQAITDALIRLTAQCAAHQVQIAGRPE